MKSTRNILVISLLALIFSCSKKEGVVNIEILTYEVKKGIGIDLLSIKEKTDLKYDTNSDYYTDAMFELGDVAYSDILRDFGIFQVKSNGDSLNISEKQRNMRSMFNALRISIDTISCLSKFSDAICNTKSAFINFAERNSQEPDYYVDYFQIAEELYEYRKDKIISEEAYNYFVLYFHVLLSVDCQGNKPHPFNNSYL